MSKAAFKQRSISMFVKPPEKEVFDQPNQPNQRKESKDSDQGRSISSNQTKIERKYMEEESGYISFSFSFHFFLCH